MDAAVGRQLRVERADEHRVPGARARRVPFCQASTSTPGPTDSITGARMKTARNGPPSSPLDRRGPSRSDSTLPAVARCAARGRRRRRRAPRRCDGIGDLAGAEDQPGARPEGRQPVLQERSASGSRSPRRVEQLADGGRLAAGDHDARRAVEVGPGAAPSPTVGAAVGEGLRRGRPNAPWSATTPTRRAPLTNRGRRGARRRATSVMPTIGSPRPRLTLATTSALSKCVVASTIARARLRRVAALEDAGADEHGLRAELHHQRGVRRGGDAARRRTAARAARPSRATSQHQLVRRTELASPRS